MTTGTGADDRRVIDGGDGFPGKRCVTAVAVICRIDMGCIFTTCGGAIVTTRTRADDRTVIDGRYRFPGIGRMAIVAGVGGVDMRGVFT